ncbi:type IV pilus twitching motility protein PilT [Citrobacter sp. RHB21-C05]|uniref:type IV pilus twitching motility protein PilT n=1 Tax=Citrobacter TaxID=544 RepID=UPI0015EA7FD6|nr:MULTISPECIES: type IV pilus twitching motility protein PilT [Citrobacter]EHG7580613.1 type IV pilus twitching motility protein PilT [Citrobacter sedlakii]EIQ7160227.1 type IV pilus twitching motility protein PilT [Citrobacter sedlakii]MBN6597400.1 type IV pilus twitching motility protein PilT [Citrobacter sedlakii]QMK47461.1 type IV pilus twitching motility protein PilT [Citrobacter sp. RHB21-C05]QMK65905.1 type IV pilus twitching motility protein PilT [Citrobacter sp. RHB21-C01]
MNMEEIVALSVKHNVSDLHLSNAWPARWRKRGRLEAAPFPIPDMDSLLAQWLDARQLAVFQQEGQLDFAVTLTGNQRLRASAFRQQRGISLALRLLPSRCATLEALTTPAALPELLASENGLILVTGATGSGKSTTLAAMVDWLNRHTDGHILTLEDPIEYIYASQRCLIQQREIGMHCSSFAAGLRAALREDPDVILLGELRDSETIRLALTAAETGHLVLATLHTRGAAQAVERLVDTFPAQEKEPVRSQLAGSLRAVLSQKLEPDKQEGRVALFELLINTPATGNLIREGKTHQLPHVIQTGQQAGMMTFAQSWQQRQAQGRV